LHKPVEVIGHDDVRERRGTSRNLLTVQRPYDDAAEVKIREQRYAVACHRGNQIDLSAKR